MLWLGEPAPAQSKLVFVDCKFTVVGRKPPQSDDSPKRSNGARTICSIPAYSGTIAAEFVCFHQLGIHVRSGMRGNLDLGFPARGGGRFLTSVRLRQRRLLPKQGAHAHDVVELLWRIKAPQVTKNEGGCQ
jgi:hypothetical protein